METSRPNQLIFDLGHKVSFAEEDFVVSGANRQAFEHVKNHKNWSNHLSLILGPAKSGKSHLAGIWVREVKAQIIAADEGHSLADLEPNQPVLLEDVDRNTYDEHWLFHVLNQAMRGQRQLLMTARMPVDQWPYTTADVKSRAQQAIKVEVDPADDILLTQMFVKLLSDRQISVDLKTIAYLVARMERSAEEAVALTGLLDKLSLSKGRAITKAIAAEALAERDRQLGLNIQ